MKKTWTELQSLAREKTFLPDLAAGALILCLMAFLFYDSLFMTLFLIPLLLPILQELCALHRRQQRKALTVQFRELMNSVMTNLKAGLSPEHAFLESKEDLCFQFGTGSAIAEVLDRIEKGLSNHVPLENILSDVASRSGIEEVSQFAEVFAIAKRSGGNMTEVLGRSVSLISERMEVESEITVMVQSKKLEAYIMMLVPFGIIGYIRLTSPGFFDDLYHNAAGILFMSVCLAVYLAAVKLTEKILRIEV